MGMVVDGDGNGKSNCNTNQQQNEGDAQSTGSDGDGDGDGAVDRTATATPSNSRTKEWRSKTKQQPHHHAAASWMTVAAAAIMTHDTKQQPGDAKYGRSLVTLGGGGGIRNNCYHATNGNGAINISHSTVKTTTTVLWTRNPKKFTGDNHRASEQQFHGTMAVALQQVVSLLVKVPQEIKHKKTINQWRQCRQAR